MSYSFGNQSNNRLTGLHPDLIRVVQRAMSMQIMDFSVVEGVRSLDRQKDLVRDGKSKTMRSKHLIQNDGHGHAVDLYPYPINMKAVNANNVKEIARFGVLAGVIKAAAHLEGVQIINGMDWDGDGETLDHTFFDGPHFQLMGV
tara:strand:+ start:534 stop:965 length:432 start_codon:yes stop_codon:yes gene_type:complete